MFIRIKILLLSLILLSKPFGAFSQENELILKAGFIEKFARFTHWPQSNSDFFEIAVIGNSEFHEVLDQFYSNISINNLPVKIKTIKAINEIENSHILFIGNSESNRLSDILVYTQDKNILTISDTKNFAEKGVLINFYKTNHNTIHFEINKAKVKQSGLKIDALLLSYAKIINL